MKGFALTSVAAAAMIGASLVAATPAAAADHKPAKPDTQCMQAGIAVLKDAGLFSSVARDGLPISTAVSVGVTVRGDAASIAGLPKNLPLSVVLADHRAGDNSLFLYPWCPAK